ncbi:predicted protein [Naegleria gruberi]|uniref:Predicted protein n=1 Tax=Naegleria gruberi TaxID=5762 RepID=D2VHK6_NAEGR|nr:uncharacterized protein NAEGRDRAFT_68359 [Naegleria gruberi]EFC43695.1 predicted protein [Naegleria gruberi]|eukprot:XP_002676439.1 predicted protein [Naegleria gruberi strain NEG-M]
MNHGGGDNDWDDVFVSSSTTNGGGGVTNSQQQGPTNDVIFATNNSLGSSSSFGGVNNNPYSSSSTLYSNNITTTNNNYNRNEPVLIDEYSSSTINSASNSNLIGLHEPTLNDLVNNNNNGGLKSKIKNKLKRKKKKGGVRFQDEANDDDNDDDDEVSSSDEDDGKVKTDRVKPSLPLQKQDTNEKGFTEVILPPLPENRAINNLSSQQTINSGSTGGGVNGGATTEEPVSKLMKGDTPHWLFILSFVVPTIVVCSILAAIQLGVCAYLFGQINSDPTFKNDPNALTWEHNCTLVDISNDCAERGKYLDRGTYCYFDVKFPSLKNVTENNGTILELTTFLPYNMEETGIYFPMKVGDIVLCYTNKKEDLVNIIEPISTRYEAYYVAGGILGVFGSISVVAAVCVIPTAFVRPKNRIY